LALTANSLSREIAVLASVAATAAPASNQAVDDSHDCDCRIVELKHEWLE
jgi:hypothetical protein